MMNSVEKKDKIKDDARSPVMQEDLKRASRDKCTNTDDFYVFGIDLGTTNTVVAMASGKDKPKVVFVNSKPKIPSVVTFDKRQVHVGHEAITSEVSPRTTIRCIKRIMGRSTADLEATDELKTITFDYKDDEDGYLAVKIGKKTWAPELVSAFILGKVCEELKSRFNLNKPPKTVISVPAYFNQIQRHATRSAGIISGLDVLRVVNEPTCAAFASELIHPDSADCKKVLVYDFGGGTFDATCLVMENKRLDVRGTKGDSSLGGEDVDFAIAEFALEELLNNAEIEDVDTKIKEARNDGVRMDKLRKAARRAKEALSDADKSQLHVPSFIDDKDISISLTNTDLTDILHKIVERTMSHVSECLDDAKIPAESLTDIILIGGSSNLRCVKERLSGEFGQSKLNRKADVDCAVALGAAACAYQASQNTENLDLTGYNLLDITSSALGVDVEPNRYQVVIPKGVKVPHYHQHTFFALPDADGAHFFIREGDDEKVRENNKLLGEFILDVDPDPDGRELSTTFHLTTDFVLTTTACETEYEGVDGKRKEDVQHLSIKGLNRSRRSAQIKRYNDTLVCDEVDRCVQLISSRLLTMQRQTKKQTKKPEAYFTSLGKWVNNAKRTSVVKVVTAPHVKTVKCVAEHTKQISILVKTCTELCRALEERTDMLSEEEVKLRDGLDSQLESLTMETDKDKLKELNSQYQDLVLKAKKLKKKKLCK